MADEILASTVTEIIEAWPVSFIIGFIIGIVLAQRGYKIVRTKNGDTEDHG